MATFQNGDRVAYRASFLRQIGDYSFDAASRRGVVVEVQEGDKFRPIPRVVVRWDDLDEDRTVGIGVLIRADRIHLEPA